jgi:D-alanyl-lipoteichoic acid acyltransferase DltB (MBOAT superfamily)
MTLSSWLKTYVYNPLLMTLMRKYPSRAVEPFLGVIAFFVTFFLIGYWHGRTSEFIFYGVLLAVGVSVNKLYQLAMARVLGRRRYRALANNWIYQSFSRGLNFVFFCFYLLWFWSNWKDIGSMNRALGLRAQLLMWLMIWIVSTILLAAWELVRNGALNVHWRGVRLVRSRYVRTVWDTVLALLLVVVMELLSLPAPDLVYKAF